MLTGLASLVPKLKFLLNENSTTILTGVGVTGTVATAYLTGRATFKAAEVIREAGPTEVTHKPDPDNPDESILVVDRWTNFDKAKMVWQLYILPAGVGLTTIASIIAAHRISSKRIAALVVASGVSERALAEYKAKVIEKLGEKQDQKIHDDIARDRVKNEPGGSREVILSGDGQVLCYDMLTGRYFQSTVENIKRAENKMNSQLNQHMSASLSEFFDEIGLRPTTYTDSVGWNADHQIKVQFSTVFSDDDRPCIAIDFVNPPNMEYASLYN